MGDGVFFFEGMYAGFSDVDKFEESIKYRAAKDITPAMLRQQGKIPSGLQELMKSSQLEQHDQTNSSAFPSSVSSYDSFVDKIHDQAAGELPVGERPLPYFSSALVKKIEPLEEAKGIKNA